MGGASKAPGQVKPREARKAQLRYTKDIIKLMRETPELAGFFGAQSELLGAAQQQLQQGPGALEQGLTERGQELLNLRGELSPEESSRISQQALSTAALQGVATSPAAIIREATALLGGSRQVEAQRLQQVAAILGQTSGLQTQRFGTLGAALGGFTAGPLLGQRGVGDFGSLVSAGQPTTGPLAAGVAGGLAGAGIGATAGGPYGALVGAGVGFLGGAASAY